MRRTRTCLPSHPGPTPCQVGFWYGAYARTNEARGGGGGGYAAAVGSGSAAVGGTRDDGPYRLFRAGVESLAALACGARGDILRGWPRLVWREATPQHFAGGEYTEHTHAQRDGPPTRCAPLERGAARRAYDRLAAPLLDAVERQRGGAHGGGAHGGGARCGGEPPWRVLPAFWPLVSRHVDHPGLTPGPQAGRPQAGRPHRADCTHWRGCSAAMGYLNELLLDALARMPQPLAHAHGP